MCFWAKEWMLSLSLSLSPPSRLRKEQKVGRKEEGEAGEGEARQAGPIIFHTASIKVPLN